MMYAQAAAAIYLAFVAFKVDVANTKSVLVFKVPLFIIAMVLGFGAYVPLAAEWVK